MTRRSDEGSEIRSKPASRLDPLFLELRASDANGDESLEDLVRDGICVTDRVDDVRARRGVVGPNIGSTVGESIAEKQLR